jgi:preprotein translocase subunit SecA
MILLAPAAGQWDTGRLDAMVRSILTLDIPIKQPSRNQAADSAALRERISKTAEDWMNGKVKAFGGDTINDVLRRIMMAVLDELWAEQLARLEHLKRMIADRHLPPQKSVADFAIEAFALFETMMRDFRHEVTAHVMRLGKTQL